MPSSRRLLVLQVAALGYDLVKGRTAPGGMSWQAADPVLPAVTCSAQATFRTAQGASSHGMVANGLFFRDLRKPMFWEQSAALVKGPRIWDAFRAAGGTVGLLFWQQSLGENADLILSPKPVHKHGGGLWQDVYSQPGGLYEELCGEIGRRFDLKHYWGPLASAKSSDWIAGAIESVLARPDAPDLLLGYLPHLDYDLQRHGPGSPQADTALDEVLSWLERLTGTARERGYEVLVYGDYAIQSAHNGAVFPNRALREAGLFRVRHVKGRAYPDFCANGAFAMADHQVAHVYAAPGKMEAAHECLRSLPGIDAVLQGESLREAGLDHPNSGELVLVAEEGCWLAYPWWTDHGEAPDYAAHVDIHNKPGYDPCELFFGWPPTRVSMDTSRVKGTHGRIGPGCRAAWTGTLDLAGDASSLTGLAACVRDWLDHRAG